MVKPFTEEQKRRFMEDVQRHNDRFHDGENVRCNYYSECWKTKREEWAAEDKAAREVKDSA